MESGSENICQLRAERLKECEFCDEFSGGQRNEYVCRYGLSANRALVNGPLRVLPTLGQITEGHLLIIPVRHLCALADLSNEQIRELEDLREHVRSVLLDAYGACIFFEHGIRNEGSGGCGIDHAHMHAVPVTAHGVLKILQKEFGGRSIHSIAEIRRILGHNSSYLFFEDALAQRYVFTVDNLPSQYMRKLVAASIGKSDWDWRKRGHEPELISTVQRLTPLFSPLATTQRG
jgi:diadenosine tetraphosphate (Ap4A) HIT family hydrolase